MSNPKITKSHFILLGCILLVVNAVLFQPNGVTVANDTHRYIEYATNLAHGFYFDPHNFWYFGYVIFLYGCSLISDSLYFVVIIQYVLSFFATFALYHASKNIFNNDKSALITSLLFVLYVEIAAWNSYLLTESIYISFICFSIFFLTEVFLHKRRTAFTITLLVFCLVVTSLIKPTGIAVPASLLICLLAFSFKRLKKVFSIPLVVISLVVLYVVLNKMLTTFQIIENYQMGEVIYRISTMGSSATRYLTLTPPDNLIIPGPDIPPVIRIIEFTINHPVYWMKLFLAKCFYLLAHIRPYWSVTHNLFSIFFLLPTYYFFIQTITLKRLGKYLKLITATYLIIHVLSVGLTSEDWDGRFLMPMLPVIFLFSGNGSNAWINSLQSRINGSSTR